MTSSGSGRPLGPRSRRTRDPYGLLPSGTPIAAALAMIGLLAIAFGTLAVSNGDLPFTGGGGGPNGSGGGGVTRTPTPSNLVVVPDDPLADVPGSIVYVKDGNVWVQSGRTTRQLTTGGMDSMASFSADGASVYFVRTRDQMGRWPMLGKVTRYQLSIPSLMQVPASGGDATTIMDGAVKPSSKYLWMGWIREPVVSPDGKTIAMVTDLPDPTKSDVTLKLLTLASGKLTDLNLSEVPALGHQDPAWRPDGARLLYVRNDRNGAQGTPQIYSYNPKTKTTSAVTRPGYLQPSWSPDGRYIVATKTSAFGTDIVILDATNGSELIRLTNDGNSWAPTWSPMGDEIAFLHVTGQVVDLRMVQLGGAGPTWTVKGSLDLTSSAGLDSLSRPDWYVPASLLPATPAPTLAPSQVSPSPSPS
jgi:Tol biopolymer transport system component